MTALLAKLRVLRGGTRLVARGSSCLIALVVLVAATGCGGSGGGGGAPVTEVPTAQAGMDPLAPRPLEREETVVLGLTSKLEAYAQPLLANSLGEFEKENLAVKIEYVQAEDLQLLLQRGDLDAVAGTVNAGVLNLMASGSGAKVVMPGVGLDPTSTQGFWINKEMVNPDGGELVANDFRGAKLMAPAGVGGTYAGIFYNYVSQLPGGHDFAPQDMKVESAPDSTTTVEALKSGAISVGKVNSPLDQDLAASRCCTFLPGALSRESAVWFFGAGMEQRADVGAAFVRALARTTRSRLKEGYRKDPVTMGALANVLQVKQASLEALPPLYFDPGFRLGAQDALNLQPYFRRVGALTYDNNLSEGQVFDTRYLHAIGVSG